MPKYTASPGESSSFRRVIKSASLKPEALKRSKAEIVEESHSLRQLSSSDQRLSNSELGCCRMFEVPLDFQLEHRLESVMSKPLCLRLKAILKEVSDVICSCQTSTIARAYSQSGEAVGCQLA
jgi:hypothetical protein